MAIFVFLSRGNLDDTLENVPNAIVKSENQVREHYDAFCKHFKRIAAWGGLLNRIRKGEENIERYSAEFADKIARHPYRFNTSNFPPRCEGVGN